MGGPLVEEIGDEKRSIWREANIGWSAPGVVRVEDHATVGGANCAAGRSDVPPRNGVAEKVAGDERVSKLCGKRIGKIDRAAGRWAAGHLIALELRKEVVGVQVVQRP